VGEALAGLRVVEFAEGVAGPYCGKLLAGLGAEVVKVESPSGDRSRHEGPFPGDKPDPNRSGLFLHLNTGKRSVVMDDHASSNPDLLNDLLAGADVVILGREHAQAPQSLFGPCELRQRFPGLVVTCVTPFGLSGAYADYGASEIICYALSGYMMLTGDPEREPIKAYGTLLEYQAGAQAALGTMAALLARDSSGEGQVVDTSVMEAGTFLLGGAEQHAHFYGRVVRRNGTRLIGTIAEHPYPSTIRPCKDGYVHCHSNNRYRDLLGAMVPHPRLLDPGVLAEMTGHADEIDTILDAWLADKTREEVVETAQAFRLPFTEVYRPGEVARDPRHRERRSFVEVEHPAAGKIVQPGAPFRMEKTPWITQPAPALGQHQAEPGWKPRKRTPRRSSRATVIRPLAGVRVVDFTVAVAGPITTALLADLGAEVIKVEAPDGRPLTSAGAAPLQPGAPDLPYNRLMNFNQLNHGKLGISLDVADPSGRDVFLDLVAKSDVVVQNFAPRVMPNLGLGYERLREVNPGIILISMPAFGLDGPFRDRISYGPGVDAMSGLSHLTGYADGPPMKPGNYFCDQNAAVLSAFAALVALSHRDATGEGQHVVMPMIDGEFQILGDAYIDFAMNGRERTRCGNDHPWMAPHDVFPCRGEDAWVAIAVSDDAEWTALTEVIERPELAIDPRFATASARHENREQLGSIIAGWTSGHGHYDAMHALQAAGVPAGAVVNAVELLADPHVVERQGIEYVDVEGVGLSPCPRVAFKLTGTPVPVAKPAPPFAADNDYVYHTLLGMSRDEVAGLERRGVVSRTPGGIAAPAAGGTQ
jgi:crotonobetainyl-CoA:carnitine CoA-transferase CaiB-like acyl-CoA transferase